MSYSVDLLMSEVFGEFLDVYFYGEGNDFEIERTTSSVEQNKGIDLVLSSEKYNLNHVKVDEKCSFYYINSNLKTFAFELSKKYGEGWFLSDHYETEYYLLAWPYGDKDFTQSIKNLSNQKERNTMNTDFVEALRKITGAEIMLISKRAIWDGLVDILEKDRQATSKFLKEKVQEIRETNYRKKKLESNKLKFIDKSKYPYKYVEFLKEGERIKITKSYCHWDGNCDGCFGLKDCKKRGMGTKETEPINLIINKEILAQWAIYKAIVGHQKDGSPIPVVWKKETK